MKNFDHWNSYFSAFSGHLQKIRNLLSFGRFVKWIDILWNSIQTLELLCKIQKGISTSQLPLQQFCILPLFFLSRQFLDERESSEAEALQNTPMTKAILKSFYCPVTNGYELRIRHTVNIYTCITKPSIIYTGTRSCRLTTDRLHDDREESTIPTIWGKTIIV